MYEGESRAQDIRVGVMLISAQGTRQNRSGAMRTTTAPTAATLEGPLFQLLTHTPPPIAHQPPRMLLATLSTSLTQVLVVTEEVYMLSCVNKTYQVWVFV